MNMTVAVTGGCGLIGSNLLPTLTIGRRVTVYDNLSRTSGSPQSDSQASLVVGDVRDFNSLRLAVEDHDVLIHLAAYGSVVESVSDPLINFEQNVLGTFQALRASQAAGVKRFIMASTGGALIGEAAPPVNELSLPKPISPYGASKLCGEAYCHAFTKAYGMEAVALRFANTYGPWSAHKKGAVTAFIKSILTDQPIKIFGDGSATRDFLYVDDLCDGIMRAAALPDIGGEVFHLASGIETSILELADMVRRIAGQPNHPIEFAPERPGEVARNFARYDKAEEVLGYAPKTSLEEGLIKTFRWFEDNLEFTLATTTSES